MKRAFTVFYDEAYGEVNKVSYSNEFQSETPLMKLDVVGDVIDQLTDFYNRNIRQFGEGGKHHAKSSRRKTQKAGKGKIPKG